MQIISGCRGVDARSTPHHQDQQIEVWVLTPSTWYIKFYIVEDVWFISFHGQED